MLLHSPLIFGCYSILFYWLLAEVCEMRYMQPEKRHQWKKSLVHLILASGWSRMTYGALVVEEWHGRKGLENWGEKWMAKVPWCTLFKSKCRKPRGGLLCLGFFSSFLSSRKYSWLMEKMGQQRCASPQYCCLDHIITYLKTHLSIPQSLHPVHSLTILENCEWQRNPSISTASRKAHTH